MERRLSEFFSAAAEERSGFIERRGNADPLITGLEYDSRKIQKGKLYFALKGLHANGHAFIGDAIARGASAVIHQEELPGYDPGTVFIKVKDSRFAMSPVADAFYGSPSQRLRVAGVTGTEGKSTTVYLIYQLLKLAGKKAGFISTVQSDTGGGEMPNPEHQTTPEATTVHGALDSMLRNGLEYAVLEASSHGLSPKTNRLGDAAFDAAVMTNVTHEHLEFHGTWEQYRDDKANLFRALDIWKGSKQGLSGGGIPFGVINADDKSASYFAGVTKQKTFFYSLKGAAAELSVVALESGAEGNNCRVRVQSSGEVIALNDRLPGAFNCANVLAALLTVSGLLERPVKDFIPLVPLLKPVRGRMTSVSRGQNFTVLVDYAHTPSSFETIFPPLRKEYSLKGKRIISVFGSAGERDTKKRGAQGRIAAAYSDVVILTDEDPRGEVPMDILEEIALGCEGKKRNEDLFLIPCRGEAIRKAFSLAGPGDLALLLGKGHENSIIYAGNVMPYDEITEAEKALAEMGYDT
ncbi:MAG: UDP-N-acetylmuramoyl-L-alanyl-D-glutamate--2,6-diaminopimelate ligase [Spirochaetaceae bacterium]|jgi:UDP-N-acetylmuramoyl-L-alanyl-D-glutamate--2,6-diaminopimelate ligase|nr:UDP-N-acetylmuramoyl-L-alanyl-D-glutamate--2,6-diaminopimelate ligase [Spirochaetaceae bacterium]